MRDNQQSNEPSPRASVPRDWVAFGRRWPEGPLVAGAPVEVEYSRAIAALVRFECARRGWSLKRLAHRAGLPVAAVKDVLDGQVLPDFQLLVAVEVALDVSLWPRGP